MRAILICFICLLIIGAANSQTPMTDSLAVTKFELYSKSNTYSPLFVHIDKTIYTNNETIWFSAYLIQNNTSYLQKHTILSVALIREDNRKIVQQSNYAMQNGLSHGSLTLPDSILPGNYQLIASTNILRKETPVAIFTQSITIKSISQQDFDVELSLLDSIVVNGSVRAKININIRDKDSRERVSINYSVGKDYNQSITLNKGEFSRIISIPQNQLQQVNPFLLISVAYKGDIQHLNIGLPKYSTSKIELRFFPEGGYMVDGLDGSLAWESLNEQQIPVSVTGVIFKDEKAIDTVSTNSYGIGNFRLNPDIRSIYKIKLLTNNFQKIEFNLPKVIKDGVALHLNNSIVNDTLHLNLKSTKKQIVKILIHNYKEIFASINTQVDTLGKNLKLTLGPLIGKGLNTISILDNIGRPLAERLFFAHYNSSVKASIRIEKPSYNTKDSVSLYVNLTNQEGKHINGIISIAAVQGNRIEFNKFQDIESYTYLNHELGKFPKSPLGRDIENKDYLENILLTKGWRRYTWQGLMNILPVDTLTQNTIQMLKGNVYIGNKPLKKATSLSVLGDSKFNIINTEIDGSFELNHENSLITEGRKLALSVNEKNKFGYKIEVKNPFLNLNQIIAEKIELSNYDYSKMIANSLDQELKSIERTIALKTVIVNASKSDKLIFGQKIKAGQNECGDYVCSYNILNCSNHTSGTLPVQGMEYYRQGGGTITYEGCSIAKDSPTVFKVSGIYTSKEFYGVDTSKLGLLEPQFLSTIYWKPGILINNNSEIKLNFSTGDITGNFKIIIQGISDTGLIYGENSFVVKR